MNKRAQQLATGKQWVFETARQIAEDLGVKATIEWPAGMEKYRKAEFDCGRHHLLITLDATTKADDRLWFSTKDLEDCPATQEIKAKLETAIRQHLKPLAPGDPKKIGF